MRYRNLAITIHNRSRRNKARGMSRIALGASEVLKTTSVESPASPSAVRDHLDAESEAWTLALKDSRSE